MFDILSKLSSIDLDAIGKQALDFKQAVENKVFSIEESQRRTEETQRRIEDKLDEILRANQIIEE